MMGIKGIPGPNQTTGRVTFFFWVFERRQVRVAVFVGTEVNVLPKAHTP